MRGGVHQALTRRSRHLWVEPQATTQRFQGIPRGPGTHQLALGEIREIAFEQARHLGLRDPHALGGLLLREPLAPNGLGDLDDQAGLDLQLVGIRRTQIGEPRCCGFVGTAWDETMPEQV
jgi:hypothetical protein